jgi:NADH-quinone oxidoreductase subunit J
VAGQVLFLLFGGLSVVAAARMVTARRSFNALLWLMGCFACIAGLYLLLESPFMAGIQLLISIGGIGILIMFAMLVTKGAMRAEGHAVRASGAAAALALALFLVMAWMAVQLPLPETALSPVPEGSLGQLGAVLVDPEMYLLPFEVVGVLLLVALIGGLYLGRER